MHVLQQWVCMFRATDDIICPSSAFEKLLYKFCDSADYLLPRLHSVNCRQNKLGQSSECLSRRCQPNSGPEGLSPRPGLISRIRPRGNQLVRLIWAYSAHGNKAFLNQIWFRSDPTKYIRHSWTSSTQKRNGARIVSNKLYKYRICVRRSTTFAQQSAHPPRLLQRGLAIAWGRGQAVAQYWCFLHNI